LNPKLQANILLVWGVIIVTKVEVQDLTNMPQNF